MAVHRVKLRPKLQLSGRRKFSPPWQRPVRSEFPMRAERNSYPGPAKKPRVETHVPYGEPAYPGPAKKPRVETHVPYGEPAYPGPAKKPRVETHVPYSEPAYPGPAKKPRVETHVPYGEPAYPGPAKKPWLETHVPYGEPERRPYAKPAQRPMEPRMNNSPSTIEKRSILLNAPPKSVSELQPLPQRLKSVLKPQPTPARPGKPVEKHTPISQKQVPFKPAEKQIPMKPAVNQVAVIPAVSQVAAKPAVNQLALKPAIKQAAVKPAVKQVAAKPAVNQAAAKPAVNQAAAKPAVNQAAAKPAVNPAAAKPAVNQAAAKPAVNQAAAKPAVKQAAAKPAVNQAAAKPAVNQAAAKPAVKQAAAKPAVNQAAAKPAVNQAAAKPAVNQAAAKPAVKQAAVKPAVNQAAAKPAVNQAAAKPAVNQAAAKPAVNQAAAKPAVNQAAAKPAVNQAAAKPAVNQAAAKPAVNQAAAKPAVKQVAVKPAEKQEAVKPAEKQMPVDPVEKQVPIKAPFKAAEKLAPAKPVEKQPAKPVQMQKAPEKEELSDELTVDGNSLSSLASGVLADEIEDIMDKVIQELPEAPTLDAEKLVVERFKTVIGEDIRNALGLNVTTRILDIHNPLYVKLGFSHKPEAGCLPAFIARFGIGAFKRIVAPGDMFAARLDSVEDFDRLCGEKNLRCGTASVTVTPCYKFLTCPSEVKSIYAVNNEVKIETNTGNQNSNSSDQTQIQSDKPDKNDENTAKDAKIDQKITVKEEVVKIKGEVNDTIEDPELFKIEVGETVVEARPVTPVKNTKPTAATPVKVNITIEAASKLDDNKDVPKENKLEVKDESTKTIDIDLKIKKEMLEGTENSGITNIVKSESNVDNKTSDEARNRGDEEMLDEQLGDEEEMTDSDFRAFMSSGIVLDECSGSEDEK